MNILTEFINDIERPTPTDSDVAQRVPFTKTIVDMTCILKRDIRNYVLVVAVGLQNEAVLPYFFERQYMLVSGVRIPCCPVWS